MVVAVVVGGDMEVTPRFTDHQGFRVDPTEAKAFEDVGLPIEEGTAELNTETFLLFLF